MIDNKTINLLLPLPHRQNKLDEDVERIRESFELLDANAKKLQTSISSEETARLAGDENITDDFTESLNTESTARSKADQALTNSIQNLQTSIQDESTARGQADQMEITARQEADQTLINNVNTLFLAVTAANKLGNKKAGEGLIIEGDTLKLDSSANASMPIGSMQLMPFRNNELPTGWYFCNNDRYANDSPQAIALNALSTNFKTDWGILDNDVSTNIPDMFYNGRGLFMRGVNGTTRQVGNRTIEENAIQNITGHVGTVNIEYSHPTGAFANNGASLNRTSGPYGTHRVNFDASRVVNTGVDVRPDNAGGTWSIYLGV